MFSLKQDNRCHSIPLFKIMTIEQESCLKTLDSYAQKIFATWLPCTSCNLPLDVCPKELGPTFIRAND